MALSLQSAQNYYQIFTLSTDLLERRLNATATATVVAPDLAPLALPWLHSIACSAWSIPGYIPMAHSRQSTRNWCQISALGTNLLERRLTGTATATVAAPVLAPLALL